MSKSSVFFKVLKFFALETVGWLVSLGQLGRDRVLLAFVGLRVL